MPKNRTPLQIANSRNNGTKSRGPKTAEGRAISSQNARKHSLRSTEMVLSDEDQAAFQGQLERMQKDLKPVGELQRRLVQTIVSCLWRLDQIPGMYAEHESSTSSALMQDEREELARLRSTMREYIQDVNLLRVLESQRLESSALEKARDRLSGRVAAAWEGTLRRVNETAGESCADLSSTGPGGPAFVHNLDTILKLQRYEVSLTRQFYTALHELERLQEARSRNVIDVNVPTARRFYEMFNAQALIARNNLYQNVMIRYSEFCAYAAQTRYFQLEQVEHQLSEIHSEYKRLGYIKSVVYNPLGGQGDGKPDWWLTYDLGPNAGVECQTAPDNGNPEVCELQSETDSPVPEMEVNGTKIV